MADFEHSLDKAPCSKPDAALRPVLFTGSFTPEPASERGGHPGSRQEVDRQTPVSDRGGIIVDWALL